VSDDCLKLTTYFGERDPGPEGFLADGLVAAYARHGVRVSALFRGVEGFGLAHGLHTDRLLTQAENLPIVSVAVDERERIERLVPEVEHLSRRGLVTLEHARLVRGGGPAGVEGETKLTVYLGRKERLDGRAAYEVVAERLHAAGARAATVLLGVDGTVDGARRRARFFGANADVPLMLIAVGPGPAIAAVAGEVGERLARALMTVEDVQRSPDGPGGRLQKLMVHTDDHDRLMARLREDGARGATALRGIWGFRGGREPHGDAFWALRRRVPVLVVVVDTPERIARAHAIAAEAPGLLTVEAVDPV
jgi:PII-like signaling protein